MTNDQIKAAAERVRRVKNGEDVDVVYPNRWMGFGPIGDNATLADAFLSMTAEGEGADTYSTRKDYADELDRAAKILTRVHPIGAVKAIGRREVAAALLKLFPEGAKRT